MSEERLGVYFGLPEVDYHLDHALGSGDVRALARSTMAYWRGSWMNPRRPPVDASTPDQEVGKAIHKIVLEGRQVFEAAYLRRPDDDPEASPPEKSALTKQWKGTAARLGKKLLHGDDYDCAVFAGAGIAAHPDLSGAFQGGEPEVSVFWVRDGVRCKARFDYLKPGGIGDIKSIANQYDREIEQCCMTEMSMRRLPMQAAHYLDARVALVGHVSAGRVYGPHNASWLDTVACTMRFAFQFVFYEKKDPPDVWSCVLSPDNPVIRFESEQIEASILRYRLAMIDFGPTRPWLSVKAVREFTMDDLPMHYGRG